MDASSSDGVVELVLALREVCERFSLDEVTRSLVVPDGSRMTVRALRDYSYAIEREDREALAA